MLIPGRLRSRLIVCVMSIMAQGAHRGRPVAAAPCTPGLRPAKSPLRGPFDLSLQASGRAEAASVQNTALSPHPCGLPRPSGNVSAILRPSAPAVSATMVNKLTTGRTNPRPGKAQPPPGKITAQPEMSCSHCAWQGYNFYVNSGQIVLPVNFLRYVSYGAGSAQGAASRRRPLYPRAPASKIAATRSLRLIPAGFGSGRGSVRAKHGPQPASMRAAPAFRERLSDFEAASTGSFSNNGE
ncbi:Uncharacterised protein [Klebsiella quasipneumoniae]|nr:Uncharacterised protein [Klebsiella quasipneumoniae]